MAPLTYSGELVIPRIVVSVGVDIGQKSDPTAIAVVEHLAPEAEQTRGMHICRFLQRLPLGTPYPVVAERLRLLYDNLLHVAQKRTQAWAMERLGHGLEVLPPLDPKIYPDATGVGQPVVDMLTLKGVTSTPVYFTHGDRRTVHPDRIVLGKAWLVSRLQSLLQSRRLILLDLKPGQQGYDESIAVRDELMNYEIRVNERANDTYGAFKTGKHDDLVTALGLACQEDWRTEGPPQDFLDFVLPQL